MARMTMTKAMKHYAPTFEETFERFLANRKAKGSSDKTLQTYHYHFRAISKYLDADKDIDLITKTDLEQMLADMRDGGLTVLIMLQFQITLTQNAPYSTVI